MPSRAAFAFRPRPRLSALLKVVRRIVGVPDYEAYVTHMRARHPGATPLSREVFLQKCLDDKYSRPGHRCC